MIFMLLYANKNKSFPDVNTLKNEFKCNHVGDLNGSPHDVEKNSKWSGVDADLLHYFVSRFCKMDPAFINEVWSFDGNNKYFSGILNVYLLSDDVNKKYIDWWSLKGDFQIRVFRISSLELSLALDLKSAASQIEGAHQYQSARRCRERIFQYNLECLNNAEISYLKRLDDQEDKIKIRFQKISERLENRAKRIFSKKKL